VGRQSALHKENSRFAAQIWVGTFPRFVLLKINQTNRADGFFGLAAVFFFGDFAGAAAATSAIFLC
jgi:hypothetical protein